MAGFEPATSCSQSRRDNRATLHPENSFRCKFQFPNAKTENNFFRWPGSGLSLYRAKSRCSTPDWVRDVYATSKDKVPTGSKTFIIPNLSIFFFSGETGTRTRAALTRWQISNLLRYHSGTSPNPHLFTHLNEVRTELPNTHRIFSGCKNTFSTYRTQLFF